MNDFIHWSTVSVDPWVWWLTALGATAYFLAVFVPVMPTPRAKLSWAARPLIPVVGIPLIGLELGSSTAELLIAYTCFTLSLPLGLGWGRRHLAQLVLDQETRGSRPDDMLPMGMIARALIVIPCVAGVGMWILIAGYLDSIR
ncbi:hypothetical protein AB0M19_10580 [Streptomyces sp. NPDC051920]|uniref:hypothetical protein n=1 Tax=Streptomyces sp. NPDC051920 TaxID=3155523 RepID=UPI003422F22F